MSRSTSNLAEALHGGRPKVTLIYHCNGHHLDHHLDHHDHSHLDYYDQNEEAHVSRKKLRHGEKVELLVKVELVSLLIAIIRTQIRLITKSKILIIIRIIRIH